MRNIKKFQNPDGGIFPEDEEYYPIWLDGITVKPSGNRLTTRDDWNWANWREKQNEREQQASESVRRGIDRNGTPIAAGIYGLAAAPFAIEGLGTQAAANGIRTGLQAMNTLFTPSSWLNPVTGARLLQPTTGAIADAAVQVPFTYDGLMGLWNQGKEGTLLSDPVSTFNHSLESLPFVGALAKGAGNLVGKLRTPKAEHVDASITFPDEIYNTYKPQVETPVVKTPDQVTPIDLPLQIQPLLDGAPVEGMLNAQGLIKKKSLLNFIKAQKNEAYQKLMNEVLDSDEFNSSFVDYQAFRQAVAKRLPKYSRAPQTAYEDYGVKEINYDPKEVDLRTYTFESDALKGSHNHFKEGNPVGHMRTMSLKEEPDRLYCLENQSDAAQARFYDKEGGQYSKYLYEMKKKGTDFEDARKRESKFLSPLQVYMKDSYFSRQVQEVLRYAAERGKKTVCFPTKETAIKIQKYGEAGLLKTVDDLKDPKLSEYNGKAKALKEATQYNPYDDNALVTEISEKYRPQIDKLNEELAQLEEAQSKKVRDAGAFSGPLKFIGKHLENKANSTFGQAIKTVSSKIQELQTQLQAELAPIYSKRTSQQQAYDQGMEKLLDEYGEPADRIKSVLRHYTEFPKQIKKLLNLDTRLITDSKGNTWYEIDVPQSYQDGTATIQFKYGGITPRVKKFDKGGASKKARRSITEVIKDRLYDFFEPLLRFGVATIKLNQDLGDYPIKNWGLFGYDVGEEMYDLNNKLNKYPKKFYRIYDRANMQPTNLEEYYNQVDQLAEEMHEDNTKYNDLYGVHDKANAELDKYYPQFIANLFGNDYVYDSTGHIKNYTLPMKAYRGWRKYVNKNINHPLEMTGNGTELVDLSKNVLRANSNTAQENLLFNEYYELKTPSIYPAQQYRDGTVKYVGDQRMGRNRFTIFSGVEDGAFKTGPIEIFNPNTKVYPARNVKARLKPVKSLLFEDQNGRLSVMWDRNNRWRQSKDYLTANPHIGLTEDLIQSPPDKLKVLYTDNIENAINNENISTDTFAKLLSDATTSRYHRYANWRSSEVHLLEDLQNTPITPSTNLKEEKIKIRREFTLRMLQNLSSEDTKKLEAFANAVTKRTKLEEQVRSLGDYMYNVMLPLSSGTNMLLYENVDGEIRPISEWGAEILDRKTVLSNPEGGLFISKIANLSPSQYEFVNNWLAEHPSYLVAPDLGGFGQTYLEQPTMKQYISQYMECLDPNNPNLYVVGTNNKPIDVNNSLEK